MIEFTAIAGSPEGLQRNKLLSLIQAIGDIGVFLIGMEGKKKSTGRSRAVHASRSSRT
jgi:hypothetical protein